MTLYLTKILVTALLIVVISEVGKTNAFLGSLLGSIPWTTFLVILWMKFEGVDLGKIEAHAEGVFWLVLPTLPFFLMLPWMLRRGWDFWLSLSIGTAVMVALYFGMVALLRKTGWYVGL